MNEHQKQLAIEIWQRYVDEGEHFKNASEEYTQEELDRRRVEVIPEVHSTFEDYLAGRRQLDEFKTLNDSINKRNRLWGFQGINGQMFFNMLTKTSRAAGRQGEFESILKRSIPLPASLEQASQILDEFAKFTGSLADTLTDKRGAPKTGSVNYFLSYFWQIQSPQQYPIYYASMVNVLQEHNLWKPSETNGKSYLSFYQLNYELLDLFCKHSDRNLTLWDVEHAFWCATQYPKQPELGFKPPEPGRQETGPRSHPQPVSLPESYIPPVVSTLPQLAVNDLQLAEVCKNMGSSIEKVFENRIDTLFKMLGYETESLGQGHGRVPDGIVLCREFHYAIAYDAKVRQQPYTMGTDERAIREYISWASEHLRKQGIKQVYFMVISSAFSGDHDDEIRNLKMETDAREVLLVEAGALIALLEARLRDPLLSLGPEGIQRLLANSGILTDADVREFQGV